MKIKPCRLGGVSIVTGTVKVCSSDDAVKKRDFSSLWQNQAINKATNIDDNLVITSREFKVIPVAIIMFLGGELTEFKPVLFLLLTKLTKVRQLVTVNDCDLHQSV